MGKKGKPPPPEGKLDKAKDCIWSWGPGRETGACWNLPRCTYVNRVVTRVSLLTYNSATVKKYLKHL